MLLWILYVFKFVFPKGVTLGEKRFHTMLETILEMRCLSKI